MFAKLFQNPNRLSLVQGLLFFIVLCLVFSLASPYFLNVSNLENILNASTVIGLMAIGTTFVIASGAIDLSSAAVMALCGTFCAWAIQKAGLDPILAVGFSVLLGAVCGLLTGMLINITKAPSFIVTLGMLSIARAAAYIVSGGMPIYGLPEDVIEIGQRHIMGISIPVIILGAGIGLGYVLLTKTRFGLHSLILGDNVFAATAMGISPQRLRLKIFALAGLYSGIAGIVFMLRTNAGDPTAGQNYELIAITAVILGGANLFGGRATIIGTTLGFLSLSVLQNGLNLLAVSTYYQILFVGLVLLCAAFISRIENPR